MSAVCVTHPPGQSVTYRPGSNPPKDLFRVALHADANAVAVVRGEPGADVAMTRHDHRALKRFGETAGWLGIQFVDYIVISTRDESRGPVYSSWRAGI